MEDNKEDNIAQKHITDILVNTGKNGYSMILETQSMTKLSEMLTKELLSNYQPEDEEFVEEYHHILESQAIGYLIGYILSLMPDHRESILSLSKGSELFDCLKELFEDWDNACCKMICMKRSGITL